MIQTSSPKSWDQTGKNSSQRSSRYEKTNTIRSRSSLPSTGLCYTWRFELTLTSDYGSNIILEGAFYCNFNTTILDASTVTIGDGVLFGPKYVEVKIKS